MDKVTFSIESDGTSQGTKVILNGENITETKNITSVSFGASAAYEYTDYDNKIEKRPESINFNYSAITVNDKGEKTHTYYNFNLNKSKWEITEKPLGKATETEDNIIGKDKQIIRDILDFKGKTNAYIPSRDELINRSNDSLNNLLEDLKKEV